jgi:hypothetical protein
MISLPPNPSMISLPEVPGMTSFLASLPTMVGLLQSGGAFTVTSCVSIAELAKKSLAVQLTMVVPTGNTAGATIYVAKKCIQVN